MTRQIDIALFAQTTGGPDVLAAVGQVFLQQLGPWRLAMHKHSTRFDAPELINLVHRMKSSCHVLAATKAAAKLDTIEHDLKQMNAVRWQPICLGLMALIQEIETELETTISLQAPRQ